MLNATYKIICPFCKEETTKYITNLWNKFVFCCENHENVNVNIHREEYIEIYNLNYIFFFIKESLSIYKITAKNRVEFIKNFSTNQIITPENFEQKLKTYLTFL